MSKNPAISLVESKHLKKSIPVLKPGDVVRVHQRIVEAGKERIQIFEGLVIAVSGSKSIDGSFKVRRIASGVGVERTFSLHSPKVAKVERVKASKVRQAKLYYIRELTGRKARLKADSYETETWEESKAVSKEESIVPGADEVVEEPKEEDFETLQENAAEEGTPAEESTEETTAESDAVTDEIDENTEEKA